MKEKYEDESINNLNIQEQPQDTSNLPREWRYVHNHLKKLIIDDPAQGIRTRSSLRDIYNYIVFILHLESKIIDEAKKDHNWRIIMQEELNQFERNNVWTLVAKPKNYPIIEIK